MKNLSIGRANAPGLGQVRPQTAEQRRVADIIRSYEIRRRHKENAPQANGVPATLPTDESESRKMLPVPSAELC